jgi:hypothetical protein
MMSKFKSILLAGTIAMLPIAAPAYAAPKEAPVAEVVESPAPTEADYDAQADVKSEAYAAEAKAKMQREMDEAIAMLEKIFGTDDLTPVDPARLTLARTTTAALIPSGSLEKMIDNMYGRMFSKFMEEMGGASDTMISIKTGVESDKIAALDEKTKNAIADMFDPHRKDRDDQILKVVRPLLSEALADMEPPMREGLAKAYARKFSGDQLGQLNSFFATPVGGLYAGESMALQADPEVMLAVIKAVPPLITKFIDRGPQVEKQLKELPKERALADLSDAEMAKLAKLMKVDVKTLKEHRDLWDTDTVEATEAVDAAADASEPWAGADAAATAADDAAMAAEAAADAAGYAVEDPAYDRSNWSAADLKRVEDLETANENASIAAQQAAEEAAANARKKLPD